MSTSGIVFLPDDFDWKSVVKPGENPKFPVLKDSIVDCILAKLGPDATYSIKRNYGRFRARAPFGEELEEGEIAPKGGFPIEKAEIMFPSAVQNKTVVISDTHNLPIRVAKVLQECAAAQHIGASRRKSRKTRKTKKTTRRR